jgi:protein involved in polysaccharide export with SLBB domain
MKMLLPFLLLTACATVKNPTPIFPEPKASIPAQEYRIQTGDLLDIRLFYNPELNESVTVRPDGRISLQLVKEIDAAGKTPAQLAELLTTRYSPQIKNPEITVIVRSFNTQKVYVDGEVNRAGLVALTEPMTVLQAIAQAGGFKDTAKVSEVILIRRDADKAKITMTVNLENAVDGSDRAQDIPLMPYDIVYVPRSNIANVNLWVDQYIRKNLPITPSLSINPFNPSNN